MAAGLREMGVEYVELVGLWSSGAVVATKCYYYYLDNLLTQLSAHPSPSLSRG